MSSQSITSVTKRGEAMRYGKKLVVVDTPGLYDTGKDNEEVMEEITKCYGITSPGLHAIVLVLQVDRFTKEEEQTVEFFLERFGKDLEKFLIIAFTHKDKLEREDMTIHDYVGTLSHDSDLRKLLSRIENRYVVFGYKGNLQDRENEVQDLLNWIDYMVESNGGQYYTNEMYNEAERILEEQWEEEKRREREQFDKRKDEYERYKEEREREWEEILKQREKEFREKIRQESESGIGGFFKAIGRFFRQFWPFSRPVKEQDEET